MQAQSVWDLRAVGAVTAVMSGSAAETMDERTSCPNSVAETKSLPQDPEKHLAAGDQNENQTQMTEKLIQQGQ